MLPKSIHVLIILVLSCFIVKSFPLYEINPEIDTFEDVKRHGKRDNSHPHDEFTPQKRWFFHKRGDDGWKSFKFQQKRGDWVPASADEYYTYFHPNCSLCNRFHLLPNLPNYLSLNIHADPAYQEKAFYNF